MADINPITTIGSGNVGPWNCIPAHFLAATGAYVTDPTVSLSSVAIKFLPLEGLMKRCFEFSAIGDGDTWDATSAIPPPYGIVSAFWLPSLDAGAGFDALTPRVTGPRSITFNCEASSRGWLLVFSRG